jgi:hypothetical protein
MSEIQDKINDLAKQVEEKLGVDKKEVLDQWADELALVKKLRNDLTAEEQEQRAFLRLRGNWKRELRSPAKFYEGMIVRVATPMDVLRTMKATAQTMFAADPKKAVTLGLTNEQGQALDPRKTFSTGTVNPDFGKVLPSERLIQNVVGVAKSNDMTKPVKFRMVLSERLAGKLDVPQFLGVKFRANIAKKQPTDGSLALNEYSSLKFRPTDIAGFPGPEAILNTYFAKDIVDIAGLEDWHTAHADDPARMCVVIGDVDFIDAVPNPSTGNIRVVLTNEEGDVEVVAWIPPHLKSLVNFGRGSRVYALGRTTQNEQNGEVRTMINVEGLWAIPKFFMAPEETPETVVTKAQEVK